MAGDAAGLTEDLDHRLAFALSLAAQAGQIAMRHFRALDGLIVETKGHQDLVSNADREVELFVRAAISAEFPGDALVGEEHAAAAGTSGYVWVIDPIDGTANFVRGIPAWCVVIACVGNGLARVGVIHEPCTGETFSAKRGGGAFLNGRPIRASQAASLREGSVGTGFSNRRDARNVAALISALLEEGGVFFRNASGALMLAYVAADRLLAYCEEHMNAWDCLAGLLLVEEAGGHILSPDPETAVEQGAMVIAAGPHVFDQIETLCRQAFSR